MIWEFTIGQVAYSVTMHLGLGFMVGLVVWLLTSTIFSLGGGQTYSHHARSIWRCSLSLAVSLSVVAHVLEDYLLHWF